MPAKSDLWGNEAGVIALEGDERVIQEFIQTRQVCNGVSGKLRNRDLIGFEKETNISPVEEIPAYLETNMQARFLDAGCGDAIASLELAERFQSPRIRLDAIDILPLEKAPKRVKFIQADLTQISISNFYNIIGMPFVIPYIPNPLKAIANMYNSLAPAQNGAPGILGFSYYLDSLL